MKRINAVKTGKNIKSLAQSNGFTALTLSEHLYLSERAVYKWYAGVNVPKVDDFIKLSEIFNKPIDELIICDTEV